MERNTERTHFTREPPTGRTTPPRQDPLVGIYQTNPIFSQLEQNETTCTVHQTNPFPPKSRNGCVRPRTHPAELPEILAAPANFPNAIISLIYTNPLLHLASLYGKLSSSSSMSSRFPARDLSPIAIIIVVIVAGPA
jgi:hypothetical protein